MKKIIFLLLLAQAISCLYGDSGCREYYWRWGRRAIQPIQCYCNCSRYAQAHGKCLQCRHIHIPEDIKTTQQ